jgi:hypothetical protein
MDAPPPFDPALCPRIPFEAIFHSQLEAEVAVPAVVEALLRDCMRLAHARHIAAETVPFAIRAVIQELRLNACWCALPLGDQPPPPLPDENLGLPRPDQLANGALTVVRPDAVALRASACAARGEWGAPRPPGARAQARAESPPPEEPQMPMPELRPAGFRARRPAPGQRAVAEEPPIAKLFEEKRKQILRANKNVTVDMELNIIPVQEQRVLGPALIVPRVAAGRARRGTEGVAQPARRVSHGIPDKAKAAGRKKPDPLVAPDLPVFEDGFTEASVADRIVCAAGVTLRDGSVVRSKPKQMKPGAMTRAQYEEYRKQMETEGAAAD